jgi:response regulator of citrate/malate metabolism
MIRTLVVDDDFMVATIHRGYTERIPGFEVIGVAHSARDALAAVREQRPDLVVLDVFLPDQSGLEVLQQIQREFPAVDVIMVTAAKDADSLLRAMQGGVLHYIVKPFDFARYQQTLESYRRFRQTRASVAARSMAGGLEQGDVDRLFALRPAAVTGDLPKGLNRPTLDLVLRQLGERPEPQSAQEVAEASGISRGTARRYLEHLYHLGRVILEPRYGTAGRPENRYRLVTSPASVSPS